MNTFVLRLHAPRPTFALDMTDDEREIMTRHAAYWQPLIDSGHMVVFGPVLDETGSWGLAVVEFDDEDDLRAFAAQDPVVTTRTGTVEMGRCLRGSSEEAERPERFGIPADPIPGEAGHAVPRREPEPQPLGTRVECLQTQP